MYLGQDNEPVNLLIHINSNQEDSSYRESNRAKKIKVV